MTVRGVPEFGGQRFAVAPYAADDTAPTFPDPTAGVTLTQPLVDVSVRLFEMAWDFEAPLDPVGVQVEYRVQVEVEGIVVIDSGWVLSASQTHLVDLAAAGIGDDDVVTFRVAAHQSQRGLSGVDESTVQVLLGQPTVAYLEPDPLSLNYQQSLLLCRWTYADTQGNAQVESRVRLLLGTQVLYDSRWIANTEQEHQVPFLLFDGSRYTVGLTVRNSEGVESVGVT